MSNVNGTVDGVSANSAIAIDITEDQHHDVDELPVDICEENLSVSHIYSRWNLWQMLDSVLPTGGFAHSYGLEAAVQAQIVPNPEALEVFGVNTLENTGSLLLPFVYRGNRFPNIEDWIKIDQILHATLTNGVARKASISQGSALLRVASTVFVEIPELKHMRECARKPGQPPFPKCRGLFHGAKLRSSALRSNLATSHKVSMAPREVEKNRIHFQQHEALAQVAHSMPPEKVEIFKSLEEWADKNILIHLKPVDQSWQPQDFLPDPSSVAFIDQLIELRERSHELPDDYLVCLVGDMITEEALPTYQSMLNTFDGVRDETGASPTSWAIWTRMWTAEENRHGDLLHKYLYLSGRVDMKKIEKTIQYLIGFGMYPGIENSPYLGLLYTSFQERATFISHGNTARLAKGYGDLKLAQICRAIAADEKRHETAYKKIVEKLFEIDGDTTMLAFEDLMRKKVVMPAHLMYDGQDGNLFNHFSSVAQRLGVYTAGDYADILEFLVERWNVKKIGGLSGKGREAQDYVCKFAPRIRKLDERTQERAKQGGTCSFSWIFNKRVLL